MTTINSSTHHAINYVEFSVLNLKRAKEFYHVAFGWRFNDYGPSYAGILGEKGCLLYTSDAADE